MNTTLAIGLWLAQAPSGTAALAEATGDVTSLVNALIVLLLVATGVALITRRLRIPYVVGLVLAGLTLTKSLLPGTVGLNAEVILNIQWPC